MKWIIVNSTDDSFVDLVTTSQREAQSVLDYHLRLTRWPHHLVELEDDADRTVIDLRSHAHAHSV